MVNYGKITRYNGNHGNIKGIDGKDYTLLEKNLVDKDAVLYDNVQFDGETITTPEVEVNMARFVKVLRKEKQRPNR